MERLPKKEPRPAAVEAKLSEYEDTKGSEAIFPYFPERSPTWQVCGRVELQMGV
jgi:hypothetical protein